MPTPATALPRLPDQEQLPDQAALDAIHDLLTRPGTAVEVVQIITGIVQATGRTLPAALVDVEVLENPVGDQQTAYVQAGDVDIFLSPTPDGLVLEVNPRTPHADRSLRLKVNGQPVIGSEPGEQAPAAHPFGPESRGHADR
ncbi:hypothetical protein GCM10010156_49390 [Planobispora rosea]|uniref:Uncharacterized protein n=1 Tax=Planobispora rosea TaxID=35762 RepID=A0A8J3WEJ1_PLARO|nr:hypothetical protein [Planobispora rosea]GGS84891.1 hypothetical protein GCM10010156_49390 [Planobispora rosea]GIH86450.1 hypothetical protein Pro02_48580 [Planobispora rosea]